MQLSQCKLCGHHICVIGNKALCGYNIDRQELSIQKDAKGVQFFNGCPKEANQ